MNRKQRSLAAAYAAMKPGHSLVREEAVIETVKKSKLRLAKKEGETEALKVIELDEFRLEKEPGPGKLELVDADDYMRSVKQLADEARRSHERRELHGEKMVQLAEHMKQLHERYTEQQETIDTLKKEGRRKLFAAADGEDLSVLAESVRAPKGVRDAFYYQTTAVDPGQLGYAAMFDGLSERAMTPHMRAFARKRLLGEGTQARILEVQALNDMVVVLDAVLAQDRDSDYARLPRRQRVQRLKVFKEWKRAYKGLRDSAMDTATSGEGSEWTVPNILSSQLHTIVMAQLVLADQFEWPTMPGPIWTDPVEGADPVAYVVGQATQDPAEAAAKVAASTITTRSFTLTAIKAMARVIVSSEIEEDFVLPAIPRILFQLARAHARFREIALVNGFKTALSGFDTGSVPATGEARTAWNGLRWFQKSVEATLSGTTTEVDLATMSGEGLAALLGAGKEYGQNPDDCFFLTGYSGYIRMLTTYDKANGSPFVLSLEKMGSAATFFRGQLGQAFGRPIIVSQYVQENLNASGIYDNVTTTKTALYHVNRTTFKGGERRSLRIQRGDELKMETDQIAIVSSWRGAFAPVNYAGAQRYVTMGKNIASY